MATSTTTPAMDFANLVAVARDTADALSDLTGAGVWSQVPLSSAADFTTDLVAVRDLLAAVVSTGVGVLHASGALPNGHVSTTRWLEVSTGMSAASARAQLARSCAVRDDYPRTRIAWLAGGLSEDKVRAITTGIPAALRRLNIREQPAVIAALEAQLVPYAEHATVAQIQRKLTRLRVALDPDGCDERSLAAYDAQQLTLTPVGDGYEVRGYLTSETAAAVLTCLDQTIDGWFRSGSLTPEMQALAGDESPMPGRRRMYRSQHNALALSELCQRLLDTGDLGTRHQQRPHVTVTVHAEEYRAGLGGELHIPGMPSEPITAAMVDRILCDADVTTVLTRPVPDTGSGDGTDLADWLQEPSREVLYVGRTQRTAPPRLRKALNVRDRHCQFPHCAVTADRCHAHHVQHWEHGGGTDLDQMVLLCNGHHHLVHEGRWTITPAEGRRPGQPGYWELAPPERRP